MRRAPRFSVTVALLAVLALGVGLLAACGGSSSTTTTASPSASSANTKAYKIGITQIVSHPALDAAVAGFKAALVEKGFTNVTYDMQNAQGDMSTNASIAQKLASEPLDLVLGVSTPSTQAVVKAITTTPIVFTAITDPVSAGLLTNPQAPSGNVTGVSDQMRVEPVLALVKLINPAAKSVGIVYNSGESNSVFIVKQVETAVAPLGLKLVKATASNASEVQAAAQSLVGRADAIVVIGDNTAVANIATIVKVCQENKIPLYAGDADSVKSGAAAGYGPNYTELGKQAGYQAALILGGTPIKDIPVIYAKDLPGNEQLSINEKSATAQGVTLPADLVAKAVNKF